MHPTPIPEPPLKAIALREAARGGGIPERFKLVDLAIFWGKQGGERGKWYRDPYGAGGAPQAACQMCGECFLGCNTHSKNTMDLTFLWHAERAGAEVYSQHRVSYIEPRPGGGYTVHFDDVRWGLGGTVTAKNVIVSAGCMGSTELMLRCKYGFKRGRQRIPPSLPRISDMLGRYFSGNGDFGSVAFRSRRITEPAAGPTITAALDCRDYLDGHGFYLEEGGIPDVLRAYWRLLPGGLPTGRRIMRKLRRLLSSGQGARLTDQLYQLLDLESARNALPYLTMGIDAADGAIGIDGDGNLRIHWDNAQSMRYLRKVEETLRGISETPI
jgi:cholesterol oxidase